MKNTLLKMGALALLVAPLALAATAEAASPNWNTSGTYVVAMNYLGTDYTHDMVLTQGPLGALTGHGGSPVGANVYTWVITSGTVSGDSIDFLANYTATADAVTPQTTMHVMGTIAPNGTISGTWSDNYQGGARSGTLMTVSGAAVKDGVLAAEDFGVVNYDTGLGMLKGYSAGFGLTSASFLGAQSVVVKLYNGTTLLQTNTGTAQLATLTGTQISSPFDVSGNFNYVTDGYWVNTREAQYGQSVPATRVVATVTLANGKIVTAENTVVAGDPTTIYPVAQPTAPLITSPANGVVLTSTLLTEIDWTVATGAHGPFTYQYQAFSDVGYTTSLYDSGFTLSATHIATVGTPNGTYYVRVRAKDANGVMSEWSNGATSPYKIVVSDVVTPPVVTTPTTKSQCKDNGWKSFTKPTFKNQGQCVAFVEHLKDHDSDKKEGHDSDKKDEKEHKSH